MARFRPRSGRALPRRPPRCRARLERRPALDLNQLERSSWPRAGRSPSRSEARPAHEPAPPHPAGRVALLLVAALAGRSPHPARDARDARPPLAQRLGAQALVEEDFDRSLLLARQAVAIDDSPQTRSYLLADLLRAPRSRASCTAATSSARSRSAQTGARSWSALSPGSSSTPGPERIEKPVPVSGGVESLAFGPDGRTVAFGGSGCAPDVARTRKQLAEERGLPDVSRLTFTRDGSRLVVVASGDSERCSISVLRRHPGGAGSPDLPPACGAFVGSYFASRVRARARRQRSVVSASDQGELVWWDLETRKATGRSRSARIILPSR